MDNNNKTKLREFIKKTLEEHSDYDELADSDSLFDSGRLSSLSILMLVVYLEKAFNINFANVDFDVELIDSVNDIESFVDSALASC